MLDFKIWYKCWLWQVVLFKRESASSSLSFPSFVHFSFSPIKFFVTDFLAPMRARVFKFCIHLECGQLVGKKTKMLKLIFPLLFPFFLFPISHSNVIHREICIHLERGQVYCGKENQDALIIFCLLFPSLAPM